MYLYLFSTFTRAHTNTPCSCVNCVDETKHEHLFIRAFCDAIVIILFVNISNLDEM